MIIEQVRKDFYPDITLGGMYIDGTWFCYVLEDTDRKLEDGGIKIPGKTAIPRGHYQVIIDMSDRFKRRMPHILNVPQFEGIRIHAGNRPEDTEGCPILGFQRRIDNNTVFESILAFEEFLFRLYDGLKTGEVWVNIT